MQHAAAPYARTADWCAADSCVIVLWGGLRELVQEDEDDGEGGSDEEEEQEREPKRKKSAFIDDAAEDDDDDEVRCHSGPPLPQPLSG